MTAATPQYMILNGELVPYAEARIHAQAVGLRYGANIFEGIRAYWNDEREELYLFRHEDHLRRLQRSMKLMRFEPPWSLRELREPLLTLLRANGFREDLHVWQQVFLAGEGAPDVGGPLGMSIYCGPRGRVKKSEGGLDGCVSSWARISDAAMPPRIKCSANYHNGRLALLQAKADGYDCTVLLNSRGKVAEAPGACLFIVRDGVPITPPITSDILESITRATLIQLFPEVHELPVQEREIDRSELYVADELFLCGSGWEITPVVSVDRYRIGDGTIGPVTRAIQETYFSVVRGRGELHKDWLTPVYKV